MFGWLTRSFERFTGAGDAALTVPTMDGALKPNRALDECAGAPATRPDNLARHGGRVVFTSDRELLTLDPSRPAIGSDLLMSFESRIEALATASDGGLAVALASGELRCVGGQFDGLELANWSKQSLSCVTALAFGSDEDLIVCVGSMTNSADFWQKDLLESGSSGSVWRLSLRSREAIQLCDGLAFPYGVLVEQGGAKLVVSESWRHRLLRLDAHAKSQPEIVLDDLPGYPARLCDDPAGGAWLAIFAPRNQLVEFVIREPEYRDDMIRTIPSDYWIAPSLRSRGSFLEPLQGGAVRQMGMLKPWAPTRSYGLVLRLGPDLQPVASFHSRANGSRHGIASCLVDGDRLLAASKGGNEVLVCSASAS
jgi:hypothetical protein